MTTTVSAERPIVGVGAVVVDDGRMLLVKRGGAVRRGQWAVPGGKLEFGEALEAGAVREVKEETGLDIELGSVIWVGNGMGDGDPPDHHIVLVDFSARIVGGSLEASDDATEARLVPIDQVRDLDLTPSMFALLDDLGL